MSRELVIRRDRSIPVNPKIFRRVAGMLLEEFFALDDFSLGIHLVRSDEMARINLQFLQHEGSTDVITFDHAKLETRNPKAETALHGEIFICYDDAVSQSREFRTVWQGEIVRYLVHGVLHLRGFDDHRAEDRRKMKREENRLVRELGKQFDFDALAAFLSARRKKVAAANGASKRFKLARHSASH